MSESRIDPTALRTAIAVLAGGITVILDSTIVSVALHELATDLHADVATIQWVSTAYLLALGVVIPVVGWLQSRLGGKRLWIAALTVFLLGSVLCSFAWDAPSLIGFRVLQGLGGGAMMPLMMTMIMQQVRGKDIGRLMSLVALPAALGPILGPVIGGLILGAGSWRWLFLVNVPLCLIGLALAVRLIPADEPGRRIRLDVVGLVLLSPRWSPCSTACPRCPASTASRAPARWSRCSAGRRCWSRSCSGRCAGRTPRWSTWRCCAPGRPGRRPR